VLDGHPIAANLAIIFLATETVRHQLNRFYSRHQNNRVFILLHYLRLILFIILNAFRLYFDPSFYIPSSVSHTILIFVIFGAIILTLTLHLIVFAFHMNNIKIPEDLLSLTQILQFIIIFALPHTLMGIYAKPFVCLLPNLNGSDMNIDHCNSLKLISVNMVIGIIAFFFFTIYGYFLKFFTFQS
jgi:hypothetical protein